MKIRPFSTIGARPRAIFASGLLLVISQAAAGCIVSQTRYDELDRAFRMESGAHRQTRARLYEIEQKLANLWAVLAEREQRLAQNENQLAQSELDANRASQERQTTDQVVEQLRNDLSRVGDHLRIFGEQKASLEEALAAAEARSQRVAAAERHAAKAAIVLRDLARELKQPLGAGDVELDVDNGRPVVRIDRAKLLTEGDQGIAPAAQEILGGLTRVAKANAASRLSLSERGEGTPEQSVARLRRVRDALVAQGIDQSLVVVEMSPEQKAAASELSAQEAERELERAVNATGGPPRDSGDMMDPGESPPEDVHGANAAASPASQASRIVVALAFQE